MKKIYTLITCLVVLCGCTSRWEYTPRQYKESEESKYSIQIPEFSDIRKEDTEDAFRGKEYAVHFLPIIPGTTVTNVHHPEGTLIDMPDMKTTLPEATAAELAGSGLFETISVLPQKEEKADYTLKGTIVETHSSKDIRAYGLSLIGKAISVLGIPSGVARNSMTIQFQLTDKNKKVVFERSYTENSSRPVFIYNELSKRHFAQQAEVYQNINRRLIKDLKENVLK